jgi:enoyl-CoA hydratase
MTSLKKQTTEATYHILKLKDDGNQAFIDFEAHSNEENIYEILLDDLKKLVIYLEDESTVKVVIFSMLNNDLTDISFYPESDFFRRWEKVLNQFSRLPIIKIAVINGNCIRFNMQFTLICDYRIATENSVFISPEVNEGFLPGMSTFYLAKFVGLGLARRIILTGRPLEAKQAFECGLVDEIVSSNNLDNDIVDFINNISPTYPMVHHLASRLVNESFSNSYDQSLGHFLAAQNKCADPK